MKRLLYLLPVLFLTSCATICGGRKYHAQVMIPNCPDAEVSYNGTFIGNSSAKFTVKRKDANKVVLSVNHPSYDPRVYTFDERSFRG